MVSFNEFNLAVSARNNVTIIEVNEEVCNQQFGGIMTTFVSVDVQINTNLVE
jgi:hypothetical protein